MLASPISPAIMGPPKTKKTATLRFLLLAQWLYQMLWQFHISALLFCRRLLFITAAAQSSSAISTTEKSSTSVGEGEHVVYYLLKPD
jgi:hypothetical protein